MKYVYIVKYKVNYTFDTKLKAFETLDQASDFHKNYKHHILNNNQYNKQPKEEAFITHYEILALELNQTFISENNA